MSILKNWLRDQVSTESDTRVQTGNTPKEGFGQSATTTDTDLAKPAKAELDAASDGVGKGTDVDQGHQHIHKPAPGDTPDGDIEDLEDKGVDVEGRVVSAEADATTEVSKGGHNSGADMKDPDAMDLEDESTPRDHEGGEETAPLEEGAGHQKGPGDDSRISADDTTSPESQSHEVDLKDQPKPSASTEAGEYTDETLVGTDDTPADVEVTPPEDTLPATVLETTTEPDAAPIADEPVGVDDDDYEYGDDELYDDADIVATRQDVTDFVDMTDSVEAFYQLMQDSLPQGGMSAQTARAVQLGLENIDPVFVGDVGQRGAFPACEAFGETLSCESATGQAMVAVNNGRASTMDAVKAAVEKLLKMIRDYFHNYLTGLGRMQRRAEQLKSRLDQVKTSDLRTELSFNGSAGLSVEGRFMGLDLQTLKNLNACSLYAFRTFPDEASKVVKRGGFQIKNMVQDIVREGTSADQARKNLADEMRTVYTANGAFGRLPGAHTVGSQTMSMLLPGNRAIVTASPEADITSVIRMATPHMEAVNTQSGGGATSERAPSKADLKNLLGEITSLLKQGDASKGVSQKLDAARKELIKNASAASGNDAESALVRSGVAGITSTMVSTMAKLPQEFAAYLASTLRQYLAVIEYCIDAYEKADRQQVDTVRA